MSLDLPSVNQVTIQGSVGVTQLSSVSNFVTQFFIQAMASNIGYIFVGKTSSVTATTAIAILDSAQGVEFSIGDFNRQYPKFDLKNYFVTASASQDKATLVWFN